MPNEFDRHNPKIERDGGGLASPLDAPAFLTVRELARVLRIGRNQAYALVNKGQVVSCRFGGSIRVPRSAVERLMAASGTAPSEA